MRYCSVCGKPASEVGRLSVRGKCAPCGDELVQTAIREIRAHNGPTFQRWRRNHAAAVGAIIPPRESQGGTTP